MIGTAIRKEGRIIPHHKPLPHWVPVRPIDTLFSSLLAAQRPASTTEPAVSTTPATSAGASAASRPSEEVLEVPSRGWIRLMKLDVQGFECRALEGMGRLLRAQIVQAIKTEVSGEGR